MKSCPKDEELRVHSAVQVYPSTPLFGNKYIWATDWTFRSSRLLDPLQPEGPAVPLSLNLMKWKVGIAYGGGDTNLNVSGATCKIEF